MPNVVRHPGFAAWFSRLRDERAFARITLRLNRLALGNPGDVRPVGEGVSEMRIDYGPGYRVYCVQKGEEVIVVLCGGDKSSQRRDIDRAKEIARSLLPSRPAIPNGEKADE